MFYSNHFVHVSSSVMLHVLTIVRLWQNQSVSCILNFSCDNFVLECNNCAVWLWWNRICWSQGKTLDCYSVLWVSSAITSVCIFSWSQIETFSFMSGKTGSVKKYQSSCLPPYNAPTVNDHTCGLRMFRVSSALWVLLPQKWILLPCLSGQRPERSTHTISGDTRQIT